MDPLLFFDQKRFESEKNFSSRDPLSLHDAEVNRPDVSRSEVSENDEVIEADDFFNLYELVTIFF